MPSPYAAASRRLLQLTVLALELGVVPLLVPWQAAVARASARSRINRRVDS